MQRPRKSTERSIASRARRIRGVLRRLMASGWIHQIEIPSHVRFPGNLMPGSEFSTFWPVHLTKEVTLVVECMINRQGHWLKVGVILDPPLVDSFATIGYVFLSSRSSMELGEYTRAYLGATIINALQIAIETLDRIVMDARDLGAIYATADRCGLYLHQCHITSPICTCGDPWRTLRV